MTFQFSLPEKSNRSLSEFEFLHDPNDKSAKLGVGSFATVKLAREKKTGKNFALKIINVSPSKATASDLHNLKMEITVHRKLEHPNIIKYYDYIQAEQFVYIILDFADHGNLYTYHHRKKYLSEAEIFRFFHQSCLAIDYLHKNNVMHRDIKPENLLLDKNHNIKLCDFGWSTQNINDKRLTFCGTYEYMAPEIVHKTPYDYRIDIWSLGVLLFELIHREAPYKGRSLPEITRSLTTKPVNFSSSINLDAKDLILNILKVNPTERLSLQQIFNHPWVLANLVREEQPIKSPSLQSPVSKELPTQSQQTSFAEISKKALFMIDSNKQSEGYHYQQHGQSRQPHNAKDSSYHVGASSLNSLTPVHQSNKLDYQHYSQPMSLTNIGSSSQSGATPVSGLVNKSQELKKYKIFTHESPAKENAIHPIKSPSIGQLSLMASGNLSSRDKENKDFISFVGLSDLRRRDNAHNHQSFVNLKTLNDNYPSTTTHLASKGMLAINRQQSDNFSNRQAGISIDRVKRRGIFENSLSPTFKLKLTDIMSQITVNTGSKYDSSAGHHPSNGHTKKSPSNNTSFKGTRTPSQQPHGAQKENPYKFPVDNGTDTQRDPLLPKEMFEGTIKNKFSSPRSKTKLIGHNNRSQSTALRLDTKYTPIHTGLTTSHLSGDTYFNHPRPKYNQGDENVPSLTGSFTSSNFPNGLLSRTKPGELSEEGANKLEYSGNAKKNLREVDINAFTSKVEDEHPTLNLSFNKFYKGIEAKKKLDIDRHNINKENY